MSVADLDKQFFDAFGIEPIGCKDNENCTGTLDCRTQCPNAEYPQITDRILLELICIINNYCQTKLRCDYQLYSVNIGELRQEVLSDCMEYSEHIKQQVQLLLGGSI